MKPTSVAWSLAAAALLAGCAHAPPKSAAAHPGDSEAAKYRQDEKKWMEDSRKLLAEDEAGVPEGEKLTDVSDGYARLDATHVKTTLTLLRRDGKKEILEDTAEVPAQTP